MSEIENRGIEEEPSVMADFIAEVKRGLGSDEDYAKLVQEFHDKGKDIADADVMRTMGTKAGMDEATINEYIKKVGESMKDVNSKIVEMGGQVINTQDEARKE